MTQASADSISAKDQSASKRATFTSSARMVSKGGSPNHVEWAQGFDGSNSEEKVAPTNKLLIIVTIVSILLHIMLSESAWASTSKTKPTSPVTTVKLMVELDDIESITMFVDAKFRIDDCDEFGDNKLQITSNNNTLALIDTERRESRLTVALSRVTNSPIEIHLHKHRLKKVELVPQSHHETRLDIEFKAGRAVIDELIVNSLFVNLSDQAHFKIGSLNASRVDILSSDQSLLRINHVEVDQLSVTARHAASIELSGNAFRQSALTSNSSRYDAGDMESQHADVYMRDSSAVSMHVKRQVSFDMDQPSSLHLIGGAMIIN